MSAERETLFDSLDLFAGPGGWDHGIEPLGIQPLGIEWDCAACATREARGLRTLQANVADLDPLDFDPCELLIASPPCQAFSVAGKRDGEKDTPLILTAARALCDGVDIRADLRPRCTDERALLVIEPLRWALALRPRWIALEQVPPVLKLWRHFGDLLSQHGYECWGGVLSAERYGVPQTRERAFLLASISETPHPPLPTHQAYKYGVPAAEQHTIEGTLLPWISMADALGWGMTERPSVTVTAQANRSGGAAPLDGGSGARETLRRERREDRWIVRTGNNSMKHSREGSRAGEGGVVAYERSADLPAPRVDTKAPSAWTRHRPATTIAGDRRVFQPGGHHEPGKQSENAIPITLAEASVLQGFPADYPWQGGTNKERFQQVGNAVPPPLARAVITSLLGSELARRSEAVAA